VFYPDKIYIVITAENYDIRLNGPLAKPTRRESGIIYSVKKS
jgi:ribosomal protein S10